MIAFGPRSIPGGKHPRGPLLEFPRDPRTPGLAPQGSWTSCFLALRIFLIALNCFCAGVEALDGSFGDLGVGGATSKVNSGDMIVEGHNSSYSPGGLIKARTAFRPMILVHSLDFSHSPRWPNPDFTHTRKPISNKVDHPSTFSTAKINSESFTYPLESKGKENLKEERFGRNSSNNWKYHGSTIIPDSINPRVKWDDESGSGMLKSKDITVSYISKFIQSPSSGKSGIGKNCVLCNKQYFSKHEKRVAFSRNSNDSNSSTRNEVNVSTLDVPTINVLSQDSLNITGSKPGTTELNFHRCKRSIRQTMDHLETKGLDTISKRDWQQQQQQQLQQQQQQQHLLNTGNAQQFSWHKRRLAKTKTTETEQETETTKKSMSDFDNENEHGFNHIPETQMLDVSSFSLVVRKGNTDIRQTRQDRSPNVISDKNKRDISFFYPSPLMTAMHPLPRRDSWQKILFTRVKGDNKWRMVSDPLHPDGGFRNHAARKVERESYRDLQDYDLNSNLQETPGSISTRGTGIEKWRPSKDSEKLTLVIADSSRGLKVKKTANGREKVEGEGVMPVGVLDKSFRDKPERFEMRNRRNKKRVKVLSDSIEEHKGRQHSHSPKSRRKRKIEMLDVTVVEGGLAALPCNLEVEDPEDSVQLILWIKEGIHTPLYSYDYRKLLGGRPREIRPDINSTLSRRTTFRTDRSPAALIVERTEPDDAGIYRCRVDYLLSPTLNRRVNLTVIVPPSELRVSWQLGNSGLMEVHNRAAGPFLENSQPSLVCFSDDGWPAPSLSWYEGDDLLDDTFSYDPMRNLVENELLLPILTRNDLGRRLTCQASNSNKTHPTTVTISITMTLSIVDVAVAPLGVVWAGEEVDVECHVWGSRPSPSVVWWLGPMMLPSTQSVIIDEGNETISVLNFVAEPRDDGAMLICQATNEKLPDQAVQDSIVLSVNYAPVVKVSLGRSLNPQGIKEGDDVYFECSVKSKPPVFKISWRHNGRELLGGASEQILVSNMSLVVQKVMRQHAGEYSCHATNVRNTSASDPLRLDVKYAPVCASEVKTQYSVAKMENAEIVCRVHANPSDVTFRWTFNNTAEAIDVPNGRFVVVKTESRVNYTPMNDLDYGTLLCWANNTVGVQQRPCVFHIVAAGKPDPPHNCRVFDVTVSSLQVACLAGDNGGLTQNFSLRVYQIGSLTPLVEASRSSPSFSVSGLRPATAYKITITASNDKGSSKVIELKAYTIRVPETPEETNAEPARDQSQETRVPLAIAIGTAVAMVPVLVMIILVLIKSRACGVCRRSRRPREDPGSDKDSSSKEVPLIPPADESNPDIISHTAEPLVWESEKNSSISAIISSANLVSNGGTSSSSSCAVVTSSGGVAAKPHTSNVFDHKHHLLCVGSHHHHHPHIHDTTCLNTSLHAHGCLASTSAAMPQVPYYPGIGIQPQQGVQQQQEQQVTEAEVPLPAPCSLACVSGSHLPAATAAPSSYNPLVSTLGRIRQPLSSHRSCPHTDSIPLKHLHSSRQSHHHICVPHIYQQRPTAGLCLSCGLNKPVQKGLHCSLSHFHGYPNELPGLRPQAHHGSQCTLSHIQGHHSKTPVPACSRLANAGSLHRLNDAHKCCRGKTPPSILLSPPPPQRQQLMAKDGKKTVRVVKGECPRNSLSDSPSSSGQSARESAV